MTSIDIIDKQISYILSIYQNIVLQFIDLFIKILIQFQKQINIRSEYLKI